MPATGSVRFDAIGDICRVSAVLNPNPPISSALYRPEIRSMSQSSGCSGRTKELGADALAAPTLKGCLADGTAGGELALIEVHDFHLGLLPNELAGVHEGAVPPSSQGNS
jgi:hypothetical protein